MKVVEFWRWQGYSQTKCSQRRLTSLGQSMTSIEKMTERLIKKAILNSNFVLGNLSILLEEPSSLCTDYSGSLGESCFCKTEFLLLKKAPDAISIGVENCLLCQSSENLTFMEKYIKMFKHLCLRRKKIFQF